MNHPAFSDNNSDAAHRQLTMTRTQSGKTPSSALIDSELFIRQAFETDPRKGYELLFKRYYRPLCSHAVRFVYAKDVAEDVVVEVFSQFWQKQLHCSVTTSYRAYLFTTVRHAAYAHLRSEFGREVPTENLSDSANDTPPLTPQQLLQFSELSVRIDQIIRSVSPQSQKVFIMSRFEGKKNAVIADELHISVKTVEGHITRVLAILRQSLRHYGLVLLLKGLIFWGIEQGLHLFFHSNE